ncbi:MAG: YerC/YecD family TrpR-related protein [Candidatus Curtissbacteria bacterium]
MHYKPSKKEIDLFKAILALKTESESKKFFRDLLTELEIKEFANRWKVAKMLNKKTDYKTIEKETGMSSTTIARISLWLNRGMGGYKLMLNRLASHHPAKNMAG